jgi:peptidoglycan-N-acetylglucosamine deacetylase
MKPAMLLSLAVLCLVLAAVLGYGLACPRSTMLAPAIVSLDSSKKEITLTFDDGPSPYTAQILDILKKENVPASFFMCGANARRHPAIARRAAEEGHEIGNHTENHPWLYLKTASRIEGEIDAAQRAIEEATGIKPTLFRPPYGVRWFSLSGILARRGLTMALWTVREGDGGRDAKTIAAETLARLRPGAIVLLHDAKEATQDGDRSAVVEALPAIIAGAREAGYAFVPLTRSPRPSAPRGSAARERSSRSRRG